MHGQRPFSAPIAIVGMACVYPDARTPLELWENVLAQRRAFRRIPRERLRVEDYWSTDPGAPDQTYSTEAAVIEGYNFDRVSYRAVGSTFRAADMAHWLALDVAARALADAGFPEGHGLPREATGVLLGNTLTGEFSRASWDGDSFRCGAGSAAPSRRARTGALPRAFCGFPGNGQRDFRAEPTIAGRSRLLQ